MASTKSTTGASHSDATKRNMVKLTNKSYEIRFELDGTNYSPIKNIGSGAYGVVCSAIHKKTKEKVAIKKTPNIFQHNELAKRTYREIKILRHFNHDNIISIREILTPNIDDIRDIYIVLDLMESDLHQIIHSEQELTDQHARYFLYQILRGLKYIHSANVIHRDLKPSNLLVNGNCDLKIGDFGMARGFSSHNAEKVDITLTDYVATRWYRAPELILGISDYTPAVDMWSVGCILAEMLRRKQLFRGSGQVDQMDLIIKKMGPPSDKLISKCKSLQRMGFWRNYINSVENKGPVALSGLFPGVSRKALDILGKMLDMEPSERLTVGKALKHPYLSSYHDPLDEHSCIPAFNFDFEKEELSNEALREAIIKEIDSCKKVINIKSFNIKMVEQPKPPSSTESSRENSAITPRTLEAIKQIQAIAGANLAKQQQSITGSVTFTEGNRKKTDDQIVPDIQQQQGRILGSSQLKVEPDKVADDVEMLSAKTEKLSISSPIAQSNVQQIFGVNVPGKVMLKVESDKTTDEVEMISAKAEKLSLGAENKSSLKVEASKTTNEVEMLSGKLLDLKISTETEVNKKPTESKPESVVEPKPAVDPLMDAKARLRAKLSGPNRVRTLSEGEPPKPKPVTARERQKEREEKRRKKQERANQRKKKQGKDPVKSDPLNLSSADRELLEKWKNMQQKTKPFVHPIRSHMSDISHIQQQQLGDSVTTTTTGQAVSHMGDVSIVQQHGETITALPAQTGTLHPTTNQRPMHAVRNIPQTPQIMPRTPQTVVSMTPSTIQQQETPIGNSAMGLPISVEAMDQNQCMPRNKSESNLTSQHQPMLNRSVSYEPSKVTQEVPGTVTLTLPGRATVASQPNQQGAMQAMAATGVQVVTIQGPNGPVTINFQQNLPQQMGTNLQQQPLAATSIPVSVASVNCGTAILSSTILHQSNQIGVSQGSLAANMTKNTNAQTGNNSNQQQHQMQHAIVQQGEMSHPFSNIMNSVNSQTPVTTQAPVQLGSNLNRIPDSVVPSVVSSQVTPQNPWAVLVVSDAPTLPTYTEALQAKTVIPTDLPFFTQGSIDGSTSENTPINTSAVTGLFTSTSSSHSMPSVSNEQSLPSFIPNGIPDSSTVVRGADFGPLGQISDSSNDSIPNEEKVDDSPKLEEAASVGHSNSLKVNTMTRFLQRSMVDDLEMVSTPRGGGYGVGMPVDLNDLLLDPLAMESDIGVRTQSAPNSAPLSAGLLEDWQIASDMNPRELEALAREMDMGFPSPPIH